MSTETVPENKNVPFTSTSFYVTGGTLRGNAASYVRRQADETLFTSLLAGEFCYVLDARQMGKSSLMIRTAARLEAEGITVIKLDLTAVGMDLSAEQWYFGLLEGLGGHLEAELEAFWEAHRQLGALQRWFKALEAVLLPCTKGRIVIFVDEIDIVRSLPFRTDEFFAAIRECYNRRASETQMERLAFCLLGVATPSDLIQDSGMTPFNIGVRIELNDFTSQEAVLLAQGLNGGGREGVRVLERVLYWTGGHPYLTQQLCRTVAEAGAGTVEDVDRLCSDRFLSPQAQKQDNNLLFVRTHLLHSGMDVAALLDLYGRVLRGRRVLDDPADPYSERLKLAGLGRVERGQVRIRNRIYKHVFNRNWIRENMPGAELRRQRSAFHRGVRLTLSTIGALTIVFLIGFGLWRHSLDVDPVIAIPEPRAMPVKNAFTNFDAATSSLSGLGQPDDEGPFRGSKFNSKTRKDVPYTQSEMEGVVRNNADALRAFRLGLKFAYYDPQIRSIRSAQTMMPYFSRFRGLARLLRMEGEVQERRGHSGTVSYLDAIDLGGHIQHSSTMIGRIVANACQTIGRDNLWKSMEHLDAQEARRAAQRLEAIMAQEPPYATTMQEEKWVRLAEMRERFHNPDWRRTLLNDTTDTSDSVSVEGEGGRDSATSMSLWFAGKRQAMKSYADYSDACIAYVSQPYGAHTPPPSVPNDPVCARMLNKYDLRKLWCFELQNHTYNVLLTTMLALRAYRLATGAYPTTLEQLVQAGILTHVPPDPFAVNTLLHYYRRGAGCILYSIGPDGKDDNGRLTTLKYTGLLGALSFSKKKERPLDPDTTGDVSVELKI